MGCEVSGDCSVIVESACVLVGGDVGRGEGGVCQRLAACGSASGAPTITHPRPVLCVALIPEALGSLKIG